MSKEKPAEKENASSRFAFGENWTRFLKQVDEDRIRRAELSLCDMLKTTTLQGERFLDVGSGSGLFSLAARRLGATVHSFDYDPLSVACTNELKRRYFREDENWSVEWGSILDEKYISKLGCYDCVYSWGVLHHTGQMYQAFSEIIPLVANHGRLYLAIYNDQGLASKYWRYVKHIYNHNALAKYILIIVHSPFLFGLRWLLRMVTSRQGLERGMSIWYDMIDWLGGYPFEVAKPEEVVRFFRDRRFVLEELKTVGRRMGCNEFLFRRQA